MKPPRDAPAAAPLPPPLAPSRGAAPRCLGGAPRGARPSFFQTSFNRNTMIHDKTVWRHKLPVGPGPSSGPAGRRGIGVGAREPRSRAGRGLSAGGEELSAGAG